MGIVRVIYHHESDDWWARVARCWRLVCCRRHLRRGC